jgi:hypothetical protein
MKTAHAWVSIKPMINDRPLDRSLVVNGGIFLFSLAGPFSERRKVLTADFQPSEFKKKEIRLETHGGACEACRFSETVWESRSLAAQHAAPCN